MPFTLPTSIKSFHDYFLLPAVTRDVMEAFGYEYKAEILELPRAGEAMPWVADLETRLIYALRNLDFTSETARREFLIAPLLFDIAMRYNIRIRSEYAIRVNSQLKGTLDYLLSGTESLLIVEAEQADMTRGFSQLAAELVALDKWTDSKAEVLYGGISIGDIWRFGALYRTEKQLVQDVQTYTIPSDLDAIVRILVALLMQAPGAAWGAECNHVPPSRVA